MQCSRGHPLFCRVSRQESLSLHLLATDSYFLSLQFSAASVAFQWWYCHSSGPWRSPALPRLTTNRGSPRMSILLLILSVCSCEGECFNHIGHWVVLTVSPSSYSSMLPISFSLRFDSSLNILDTTSCFKSLWYSMNSKIHLERVFSFAALFRHGAPDSVPLQFPWTPWTVLWTPLWVSRCSFPQLLKTSCCCCICQVLLTTRRGTDLGVEDRWSKVILPRCEITRSMQSGGIVLHVMIASDFVCQNDIPFSCALQKWIQ